jgi:hypothetical protein
MNSKEDAIARLKAIADALKGANTKQSQEVPKVEQGDHGVLTEFALDVATIARILRLAKAMRLEELTFFLHDNAMEVDTMNIDHVTLMNAWIPQERMQRFNKGNLTHFTVIIENMLKVLEKFIKANAKFTIDPKKPDTIKVEMLDNSPMNVVYELNNTDGREYPRAPLPRIPFTAEIGVKGALLKELFSDSGKSEIAFDADPADNSFVAKVISEEASSEVPIKEPMLTLLNIKGNEKVHAVFGYDYLKEYTKAMKFSKDEEITIFYASKLPMKIRLDLRPGYFDYWLAPKVED